MKIDDKEKTALVEGAREAAPQNPSIWDQIADYFADQRSIVEPRDNKQKTNDF